MRLLTDVFDEPKIDCSSISLSIQANGIAQLSFRVYYKKGEIPFTANNTPTFSMCIAKERRFKGIITNQQVSPSVEYNNVSEWTCSSMGVICEDSECFTSGC